MLGVVGLGLGGVGPRPWTRLEFETPAHDGSAVPC